MDRQHHETKSQLRKSEIKEQRKRGQTHSKMSEEYHDKQLSRYQFRCVTTGRRRIAHHSALENRLLDRPKARVPRCFMGMRKRTGSREASVLTNAANSRMKKEESSPGHCNIDIEFPS